jgi:hypothetical protein
MFMGKQQSRAHHAQNLKGCLEVVANTIIVLAALDQRAAKSTSKCWQRLLRCPEAIQEAAGTGFIAFGT